MPDDIEIDPELVAVPWTTEPYGSRLPELSTKCAQCGTPGDSVCSDECADAVRVRLGLWLDGLEPCPHCHGGRTISVTDGKKDEERIKAGFLDLTVSLGACVTCQGTGKTWG